jgi:hypothetical protein
MLDESPEPPPQAASCIARTETTRKERKKRRFEGSMTAPSFGLLIPWGR